MGFRKTAGILGVLLIPSISFASNYTVPKAERIYKWMCEKPKKSEDTLLSGNLVLRKISKKEDVSKLDFDWVWNLHNIQAILNKENCHSNPIKIYFGVRKYKELPDYHSRQFTEYNFKDDKADGKLEEATRNFRILQSDRDDDPTWFFINPEYPPGFKNEDWGTIPKNKANELYNLELDYWLNQKETDDSKEKNPQKKQKEIPKKPMEMINSQKIA